MICENVSVQFFIGIWQDINTKEYRFWQRILKYFPHFIFHERLWLIWDYKPSVRVKKREFPPTHLYQMFGYSGRRIGVQRDGKDLDGDIPWLTRTIWLITNITITTIIIIAIVMITMIKDQGGDIPWLTSPIWLLNISHIGGYCLILTFNIYTGGRELAKCKPPASGSRSSRINGFPVFAILQTLNDSITAVCLSSSCLQMYETNFNF